MHIAIIEDFLFEDDESFILTLDTSYPDLKIANNLTIITITDNDAYGKLVHN